MANEKDNTNTSAGMMLVVLGLDADGKAHASRFMPADAEQAVRAARMMNLHAVRIDDGDLQKAATELPAGKIFVTGKGLVPFVKRELYDQLATLIGTKAEVVDESLRADSEASDAISAAADETPVGSPLDRPEADPWKAIRNGTTVLARSVDSEEGWYEAVVSSIAPDGNELTLRWRDFPGELVFKRQRRAVAVLP